MSLCHTARQTDRETAPGVFEGTQDRDEEHQTCGLGSSAPPNAEWGKPVPKSLFCLIWSKDISPAPPRPQVPLCKQELRGQRETAPRGEERGFPMRVPQLVCDGRDRDGIHISEPQEPALPLGLWLLFPSPIMVPNAGQRQQLKRGKYPEGQKLDLALAQPQIQAVLLVQCSRCGHLSCSLLS